MSRGPFIGSNRQKQAGFLACPKQQYNYHVRGEGDKHESSDVTVNPAIAGLSSSSNVRQALIDILARANSNGSGFISVGSLIGNQGNYNVGAAATPTFKSALNAAMNDTRLANGGVILILAGEYVLTSPVTIPAGITIMGEMAGTTIIGEMSEQHMFLISATGLATTIGGDSGTGEISLQQGAPLDYVKFFNITITDNSNGTVTAAGNPIATMTTVPMILVESGSNLICEEVRFIGRLNYGVVLNRAKSFGAFNYTPVAGTASGLTLKRCFFDGMRTAGHFGPDNGSLDTLVVDKCRARTFGTESAVTTANLNCFLSMSLCNATLTNNYHVGADSTTATVSSLFVITTAGGATDVNVVVSGNHGAPNNTAVAGSDKLLTDLSGTTEIMTVKTGNNWGPHVQNEWFITVGDGTNSAGDITGTAAIDQLADYLYPATVIVNRGTYDVTSALTFRFKFIGNKEYGDRPIFHLNTSTASPYLGANTVLYVDGGAEHIHFRTNTALSATYHTILVSSSFGTQDNNTAEVRDCIFEDACLIVVPFQSRAIPSVNARDTHVTVENCSFIQTDNYSDNICMLLPPADTVHVKDCHFHGNGYIGGIGYVSAIGYNSTFNEPVNVKIENCKTDLTGSSGITISSPVTGMDNYFWVVGDTIKLTMTDCQFYCDNTLATQASPIHALLAVTGSFEKFIYLSAFDITIYNCLFNGPFQSLLDGVDFYALPTLFLSPRDSCWVDSSHFRNCSLPIIFGGIDGVGTSTLQNATTTYTKELSVCNCSISSKMLAAPINGYTTAICVDHDLNGGTGRKKINILNNNISTEAGSARTYGVYQEALAGANYTGTGVVQIYAHREYSIDISGNNIVSAIDDFILCGFAIVNYAGVFVNNCDDDTSSNVGNRQVYINDNSIEVDNSMSTGGSTSQCVWVKGNEIFINNNMLFFTQSLAGAQVFCVNIDSRAKIGGTDPCPLITNNSMYRSGNLRGYVNINTNSTRGRVVDNSFDYSTVDGATTVLVADNTVQPDKWFVKRNKNQTETLTLKGFDGQVANYHIVDGISGVWEPVWAADVTQAAPTLEMQSNEDGSDLIINYKNNATEMFFWYIGLYGLLPEGVRIITATVTGTSTALFTVGTVDVVLGGVTPTDMSTAMDFTAGVGPHTVTHSPANAAAATTFVNEPEEKLYLLVRPDNTIAGNPGLQNAGDVIITFNTMSITYRW